MEAQLTKITWWVGSMREGDTRSTIRTHKAALGSYVDVFAWLLSSHIDIVMEVTTWGDTILAKLDIGDQHSCILPRANQPAPRNLAEWNQIFQNIEDEAEKVAREAHQILINLVPGLDPEPVIEHDWKPREESTTLAVSISAY